MDRSSQKNIAPLRTFADDLKQLRGEEASRNTDVLPPVEAETNLEAESESETVVAPSATTPEVSAPPTPAPDSAPAAVTPPPKTPPSQTHKSAFEFLSQTASEPAVDEPEPEPTPTPQQAPLPAPAPTAVIPETDVLQDIAEVSDTAKRTFITDEVTINDDIGTGTIIQDKVVSRWRLWPAVWAALSGWLQQTSEELQESRQATHTITKAEARLDTIKAATETAKNSPTDDHEKVLEHLRTIKRPDIKTGIVIKDQAEIPAPSWKHQVVDETSTPDESSSKVLEERVPEPEQVSVTPLAAVTPRAETEAAIDTVPEPAPIEESTPEFAMQPVPEVEPAPAPTPSTPEPVPPPTPVTKPPEPEPEPTPVTSEPSSADVSPSASAAPTSRTTGAFVFITTMVVACLIGGGVGYWFLIKPNLTPILPTATDRVMLLRASETEVPVNLTTDRLVETLAQSKRTDSTVVLTITDETGFPYTAPEVAVELAPRAPGSLTRNVNDLALGLLENDRPFIVLTTDNYETLFGGLLAWEPYMLADLVPLFEDRSFSVTGTSSIPNAFNDTIVSNKSARVLRNDRGQEILMYLFIDNTTTLIVDDRSSVEAVLPLLR